MPTDLPANLGDMLPASLAGAPMLQQTLAATAAAQLPGEFVIKKGENIAKKKGVKSTATHYIIPFTIGSIANLDSSCFQYHLNINVSAWPSGFDPYKEFTTEYHSDTVGTVTSSSQSCIVEAGKPNINWKPGKKPVTGTVTISKKFLQALRDAVTTDLVMKLTVAGYVAPPPEEEDK